MGISSLSGNLVNNTVRMMREYLGITPYALQVNTIASNAEIEIEILALLRIYHSPCLKETYESIRRLAMYTVFLLSRLRSQFCRFGWTNNLGISSAIGTMCTTHQGTLTLLSL
jgi:hypothetical protein